MSIPILSTNKFSETKLDQSIIDKAISKYKNEYELLRFKLDPNNDKVLKALEIVQKFIIKKNLIIVGGMAIDGNLKLKKHEGIYSDMDKPDYDVYSHDNVNDAYELRGLLCEEFADGGAETIPAMHLTTTRVKIFGDVVCDLTYMPSKFYLKIDTNKFGDMNIIHPWYTMADQLRSLSLPYENAPMENIINRWNKDITRFTLLHTYYPFSDYYSHVRNKKIITIESEIPKYLMNDPSLWFANAWIALLTINHRMNNDSKESKNKESIILDDLIKKYGLYITYEKDKLKYKIPGNECIIFTNEYPYVKQSDISYTEYNKLLNMHEYKLHSFKDKNSTDSILKIYNSYGFQYTLEKKYNDINIGSLASIGYYFVYDWLFLKNDISYIGLLCVLDFMDELATDAFETDNMGESSQFNIYNILNQKNKIFRPPNINASNPCDKTIVYDYTTSIIYKNDGSMIDTE